MFNRIFGFRKEPKDYISRMTYGLAEFPEIGTDGEMYYLNLPSSRTVDRVYCQSEVIGEDEIGNLRIVVPVKYSEENRIGFLKKDILNGGFPLWIPKRYFFFDSKPSVDIRVGSPNGGKVEGIYHVMKHCESIIIQGVPSCDLIWQMLIMIPSDGTRVYINRNNREVWIWYDQETKSLRVEDYNISSEARKYL